MKIYLLILLLGLSIGQAYAQGCTEHGQTPGTAFPVCGTSVFIQKQVPGCANHSIPVQGCRGDQITYEDDSPFWYKFTCFKSGTLGFLLEPVEGSDDYDWQLFDVTGHKPEDVYTDPSLYVGANWSGEHGNTGASAKGKSNLVCATTPTAAYRPLFSRMPQIIKGHQYLLLVSHFSGAEQSGYKLSFDGGTAVITDTTAPRLMQAIPVCDGRSVTVLLNKDMKCSTLASDGSDFKLLSSTAKVNEAYSKSCTDGFDMNQLTLKFDSKLKPGDYTIAIQNGTDKNTLLDNCGNGIPEGDTLQFRIEEIHPTPMDSIPDVGCAPKKVNVVFAGLMRCSSIAKNGSDFSIKNSVTGKVIAITGAAGVDCQNGLSNTIALTLAQPIVTKGRYQVTLEKGVDNNSVISECDVASQTGQMLYFQSYDTVYADIRADFTYACNKVTIDLSNSGDGEINEWQWELPNARTENQSTVTYTDTSFKTEPVSLKVSNGVCSDQKTEKIALNQDFYLHARFIEPEFVCPQDQVLFIDSSRGENITAWRWSFGNGQTFNGPDPTAQQYPTKARTRTYPVSLYLTNSRGCKDTVSKAIKVINTCIVHVPTAFTPNKDGQNDYLYPLNAYLAKDLLFKVYNRYGQMVFQTRDWTEKWDGTYKGKKEPMGSYVWMLRFTNKETGQKVFRKGATLLIR